MGNLGSRGKFFMQHILDDYWEVSTTTVDLGPKSWKTFGIGLLRKLGTIWKIWTSWEGLFACCV